MTRGTRGRGTVREHEGEPDASTVDEAVDGAKPLDSRCNSRFDTV